ncbi:MAG: hypothetical protein JXB00_03425 [Bacteroidales bacterium]|nr:hypothetical protein [Bacteroidales bacterium]
MYRTLIIILLVFLTGNCRRSDQPADIEGIAVNLEIKRFEQDLFAVDPAKVNEHIPMLKEKYGNFFDIFNHRIIRIGSDENVYYAGYLKDFITDFTNYKIYQRTREVFPDLNELQKELTDAFRHYKYYFPEKQVPSIITFISGFNQSAVSDENLLAIGLDNYLGTEEELYKQLGVYDYLVRNMHKEKIVTDCMRLWAMTEFPYNDSVNNLLSNMIYEGMVMYFTDKMLPEEPELIKWGYTEKEMSFCKNNEKQMWTYLIEHKMLFDSDKFTISKFTREGPFTKDFTSESPARAAVWLGYSIVNAYMQRHKNISLQGLMLEKDYQKILNQSGYNP